MKEGAHRAPLLEESLHVQIEDDGDREAFKSLAHSQWVREGRRGPGYGKRK